MRRYQPTTLPALARGSAPGEDSVSAVSESEEDEYAALMTAADLSAELVAGLPDGQRRRVVAVYEVGGTELLAVHVDSDDDAGPDDELAWYAPQEIAALLDY